MTEEQKTKIEAFFYRNDLTFNEFYNLGSLIDLSYGKKIEEFLESVAASRYVIFEFLEEDLIDFHKVIQIRDKGDLDADFRDDIIIRTATQEFFKYFEAARNAPDLKHFMDSVSSIETPIPTPFWDWELEEFYKECKSLIDSLIGEDDERKRRD